MIQFNRNVSNGRVFGVQVRGPNVALPTPPPPPPSFGFFLAKNFSGIFVVESGTFAIDTDNGAECTFDDAGLDIAGSGCDFKVLDTSIFYAYPGSFSLMGDLAPVTVKNGGVFKTGNDSVDSGEPSFLVGDDGSSITVDGGTCVIDTQDGGGGNTIACGAGSNPGTLTVKGTLLVGTPTDVNETYFQVADAGFGAPSTGPGNVTVEKGATVTLKSIDPDSRGTNVYVVGDLDFAGVDLTVVDATIYVLSGGILGNFGYEVTGLEVAFEDATYADSSADGVASWAWDFGDGTGTSTDRNPSYTYPDEGGPRTYTVKLTVTSGNGKVSTCAIEVTVGS